MGRLVREFVLVPSNNSGTRTQQASPTPTRLPSPATVLPRPRLSQLFALSPITTYRTPPPYSKHIPRPAPCQQNPPEHRRRRASHARASPPVHEIARIATEPMTAILARLPLQTLPTAMNRSTTRRRSRDHAFGDEDAPAAKRAKAEGNGGGRRTNGAGKAGAKAGMFPWKLRPWRKICGWAERSC